MSSPSDIAILILGGLFPVLGAATIYYLIKVRRIEKRLESTHPSQYQALGEPHLIFNNSVRNNFTFLTYLLGKRFANSSDTDLVKLCNSCRAAFLLATTVFVLMLLALFGAAAVGFVGT